MATSTFDRAVQAADADHAEETTERLAEPAGPPERSLEQQMTALARANDVRQVRAKAKRRWKAGAESPLATVLRPPADFETMKLIDVLMATPKVGRVKANKILRAGLISPSKTLGGLSHRQRSELAIMLTPWMGRPGR